MECQSLRDRLKGLQDGHQRDLAGLEDRIAELQLQLDEVSSERGCGTSRRRNNHVLHH